MKLWINRWISAFFKKKPSPDALDQQPLEDPTQLFASSFKKLHNLTLWDVMIPRADIVGINGKLSLEDIAPLFLETKTTALPVFRDTLDHVIGMLVIHDVLALQQEQKEKTAWHRRIRPVSFAPASMPSLEALTLLKERHETFLLVVDEYGGVDGLVSLERLLQEIGDLLDIWTEEEKALFETTQREDGAHIVDGRLNLDTFEEELGPFLSDAERQNDVETIGGLTCALAGRVPLRGEVITHPTSGTLFEVLEADPRRVKRVAVHLRNPRS